MVLYTKLSYLFDNFALETVLAHDPILNRGNGKIPPVDFSLITSKTLLVLK